MTSPFLGVFVALYDYQAQNEEELSLRESDLLYLLERSDVDDWWKVKKRVVDADVEEPSGLVPSTYIEPAKITDQATALYDYDKQTEEEITFSEGTKFNVYDNSDPNWILVGLNDQYGFVPSNYIELGAISAPLPSLPASSNEYGSQNALKSFPPPPQRNDRQNSVPLSTELEAPTPKMASRPSAIDSPVRDEDEDGAPPPMPSRPRTNTSASARSYASSYDEPPATTTTRSSSNNNPDEFFKDDFFTWPVHEIDGRKKKKATLAIGNSSIFISLEGSSGSKQWSINDLASYNNEKKHVFLDFRNPAASFEFHAGSKDSAEAITSILADLKGMASMGALKDVKEASTPPQNKKQGKILYDFEAASPDELTCYEGDTVIIVNDKKSKEWWMVQNMDTGEQGVIPSNYIKVVSGSSLSGFSFFNRKSSQSSLSPKKKSKKEKERKADLEREREKKERQLQLEREELDAQKRRQQRKERELREREQRNREQRERIRRNDDRLRERSMKKQSPNDNKDSSLPNPHRVRTWIDRSGAFKVEAEFLGCSDGKIHLHKVNGVKIAVAATKLSGEDLEYVERVTGMSLENYKVKKPTSAELSSAKSPSSVPVSKQTLQESGAAPNSSSSKSSGAPIFNERLNEYWFNFFLECGVDANVCERYARNFSNEQMDESILGDITTSLMRTLGLREGDILRVNKHLDAKFGRVNSELQPNGGIFKAADGSLKASKTGSALTEAVSSEKLNNNKFEDDAWASKPASQIENTKQQSVTPQLTGSIQDLVNIKPIEATKTGSSQQALPIKPVTTTNTLSTMEPMKAQKTNGTMMTTQMTGALMPMPTGFMPITMIPMMTGQMTGMMSLQPTGLAMNKTGQLTTGMPITSFGQTQKTGGVLLPLSTGTIPLTSFGANNGLMNNMATGGGFGNMPLTSFGANVTGGLVPLQPTGLRINKTGQFSSIPTTSFGQVQKTGGNLIPLPQPTGAQLNGMFPSMQPTMKTGGGFVPQSGFGTALMTGGINMANSLPATGFQQPLPQTSFGVNPQLQQQPTLGGMNQLNGMFANTSISQPQQPQPQQQNFMNMNMNMNTTGYQPQQQNFMNTGYQPQQQSFMNNTTMPMNNFNSFDSQQQQQQPLMSQPTGLGFGNAPSTSFGVGVGGGLQPQMTGRRANLSNATADNPFGF